MSTSSETSAPDLGAIHGHDPHAADAAHGGHGAGHDDGGHGDDSAYHGTFKGYMTGFVLAVILTAIPFWLVMSKAFQSSTTTALVVLAIAAVQIVVHMIYFLHMDTKSQGGWTLLALMFTVVVVVITLSGSIWVMYHLNENMMPMPTPHDMRNMP
jgi:cytochrome o ubiquinol oxidase operon protein cyoD